MFWIGFQMHDSDPGRDLDLEIKSISGGLCCPSPYSYVSGKGCYIM